MQRIHNYGSSLQAYALKRLVESLAQDVSVSFVDYRPGASLLATKDRGDGDRHGGVRRALEKAAEYGRGPGTAVDRMRFLNHKRSYGRKYFPLVGIAKDPDFDTELDVQIIGSDEVFNCVQSNTKVGYSRELFGYNARAEKVISYAGSFGNTTIEKVEAAGVIELMKHDLARFDAISVRDENSATLVNHLLGDTPPIHVDPTLAYELALDQRIPSTRLHGAKYIVVYGYPGRLTDQENLAIRDVSRRMGAEVICLGGFQDCGGRFIDCTPFELLAYFRDAEAVVTDTFHGVIFSLISGKTFAAIVRKSVNGQYGNEEKIGHLLESFGVASQRVGSDSLIRDVLAKDIDSSAVQAHLARERERARSFLLSHIL